MANPPSGTVTFLFTDIEGSTQRWQQQPAAMQLALARHDSLLRDAIEVQGGFVFKTVGDAFCAAFAEPPAALAAAVAAQRALAAEPWGEIGPIRVRMALHTGVAEAREGDYFGQPVNRVARLLATGAGGQTLLSAATQELVRDHLPEGIGLQDLGEHRLKDLARPERIYQVLVPGLAAEFPSLKTLDHRPNNLPLQLTPFVGREREVAAVRELLLKPEVRLLTLTGPGGTGKSRLSLQVAADLLEAFTDGLFFVPLEPVVDPELVLPTIAEELGVRESGGRSVAESLKDYLRTKELLLVLDNFEQVTAAGPLIVDLLRACPNVKVLMSSRHVLRVQGEREFAVPPLGLPDRSRPQSLEQLTQYEAVRLFIERAQSVKPDFAVTNDNAPAVAEICYRLDGLPLAIELAAARIKHLSPPLLLTRLGSRLQLLTGGARDLPARQQTLRGAIAWSHDLLTPEEQVLFRSLAVFAGGFTLEAAEAITLADVLDSLASLVDKSLLRQEEREHGDTRFAMLQTIHEFARERLAESGEEQPLRERHVAHYLALAEEAEPALIGPEQVHWLERLDLEHDNFRAALAWAEAHGMAEANLRLAGALARHWNAHGHISEGRAWLERALAGAPEEISSARAKALSTAGAFAQAQGDYRLGSARLEAALAMWRQLGDQRGIAEALNDLAFIARNQGDHELALSLHEEALEQARAIGDQRVTASALTGLASVAQSRVELARAVEIYHDVLALLRQIGDRRALGVVLSNLGAATNAQGDVRQAVTYLEESLALLQEVGDRIGAAYTLTNLGAAMLGTDEIERARWYFEQALPILEEQGDRYAAAIVLNNLGTVAHEQGNAAPALEFYQQSLARFADLGGQDGIAVCLEDVATTVAGQGGAEDAARLFGAAAALRDAIGAPRDPISQPMYDRGTADARATLGDERFATLYAGGEALPIDDAIAEAMALTAPPVEA